MTQTPNLALPLLDAAQAQKHVTHNEALALIDALAHLAASARATAPPATPNEGDRLLVAGGATAGFAGKEKQVATFLAGAWTFLQPRSGWRLYLAAESRMLLYDGADWVDFLSTLGEMQNLTRLGVGTSSDANNPFAAKVNAALFTAKAPTEGGTGDLRLNLNKALAANTASLLYQSNYSGRAETGLTGDNDFRIKVSADGASWKDSIVVNQTTGAVAFPSGGPAKVRTFAASGVYAPTPGMRFADVLLYGAGGGGGSGARQAAGATASGGGGGGGAGIARGRFTAEQIGASRSVVIGAGGAGGGAQTADSAAGNSGANGGATAFGSLLYAGGGGGGGGGGLNAASIGGGSGALGSAWGSAGSFGGANGGPGAPGANNTQYGAGGSGGGAPASGAAGFQGGGALYGASGGGAGGGVSAANAASAGGPGGVVIVNGVGIEAPGGATGAGGAAGGSWAASPGPLDQCGSGAGGGGSHATIPGAGGAGGFPGGGGGGGGAAQNGANSGAGGPGGAGYAVIIEYF